MKRYTETFFRYWLVAVLPLVVLLAGSAVLITKTPKQMMAQATISVVKPVDPSTTNYNIYLTPAQNEAATLRQLLHSFRFDLTVARNSPVYLNRLNRLPKASAGTVVLQDLIKNMSISTLGDNFVLIQYTNQNWMQAKEVVNSFLGSVRDEALIENQEETEMSIDYYSAQLKSAQQRLARSSRALARYLAAQHIAPSQVTIKAATNQTLASLVQAKNFDDADVTTAQHQISKLLAQRSQPPTTIWPSAYRLIDATSVSAMSSRKMAVIDLAVALSLGCLLGGGFVVAKTTLDRSVRYPEEVPLLLNLPLLATIPYSHKLSTQRIVPLPAGKAAADVQRAPARSRSGPRWKRSS